MIRLLRCDDHRIVREDLEQRAANDVGIAMDAVRHPLLAVRCVHM